jgi:hypothetical protein
MLTEARERTSRRITIEHTTITPQIAKAWLDKNINNRKISARFVAQFARDIAAGNWELTGDPIKFDVHGNLIDGQHRLAACIKADNNFSCYVAYNINPHAKDVIDTGKSRSGRDVLTMHGMTNTGPVSTALKLLIHERMGSAYTLRAAVTHSELLAALEKHPSLPLYVHAPRTFPKGLSTPLIGYVSYVGCVLTPYRDRALAMVDVMKHGIPDYDGDPMHKFREKILRAKTENAGNIRWRDHVVWTFKDCWNRFVKKQPVERVHWQKEDCDLIGLDKSKL